MNKTGWRLVIVMTGLLAAAALPEKLTASPCKVFVVMSYDDAYAWEREIREGIDGVLSDVCQLKYVYLDTKKHLADGEEKARDAWEAYQRFKPDGVIAADDNAQTLFVVPYLKDKVDAPVIFCGVNADPADYGYPAGNVAGIVERLHLRQSIAFAQQLIPSIKTIAYIMRESPSARAVMKQYEAERDTYPVESAAFETPKTLSEAVSMARELKNRIDALFFETMEGMPAPDGRLLTDREVIPVLAAEFGKPLISNNLYHVEYGALCAVVKTGQEQGRAAGEMLMDAMGGAPVSKMPIRRNREGKRVINLTVMKALGLRPVSEALRGVHLVGLGD
jgi:ABC-type uncharacterized transport system substrate-binding protein